MAIPIVEFLVGVPNTAPTLPVIPDQNVKVGNHVVINLPKLDRHVDVIKYTVARRQSDDSGTILTGVWISDDSLIIAPTLGQSGTYEFELFASDGMLEDSQVVRVNIKSDPIQTKRISGRVLDVDGTPLSGLRGDCCNSSVNAG